MTRVADTPVWLNPVGVRKCSAIRLINVGRCQNDRMRTLLHRIVVIAAGAIAIIGMVPAVAHATQTAIITVDDVSGNEGVVVCDDTGSPPCGTVVANSLYFYIRISNAPPHTAVTVGWQLQDGTAHYGTDYTGPTTGTVTIASGATGASMSVPLVSDGFNESTEGFTVHLTSASVPANLTDVGNETILDGTQIPADCSTTNPSGGLVNLTCTARPGSQQWHLRLLCFGFKPVFKFGNIVTGNGTSTVDCTGLGYDSPYFSLV
jgi:Calx-beta domain-containing protein